MEKKGDLLNQLAVISDLIEKVNKNQISLGDFLFLYTYTMIICIPRDKILNK